MLVDKRRLIELLNEDDVRVVNAAGEALERFFWDQEDIIGIFLTLLGNENKREPRRDLSLVHRMPSFPASENDVQAIIRMLLSLHGKTDDESDELSWTLNVVLLENPFPLLEKNHSLFIANPELMKTYKKAKEWDKFRLMKPDKLWQRFEQEIEIPFTEGEAGRHVYVHMLVHWLIQKDETIKPKVLACLKREDIEDETIKSFLVEMAGKLKLVEAVPFLFRILRDSDPMDIIYHDCIRYLGMLATPDLVRSIERLYIMDEEIRTGIAEILGNIPYEYSEDLCIKLFEKERDIFQRTFFAGSLCNLFSVKGREGLLDAILESEYDPLVLNLFDQLVSVYVYHRWPIDELYQLEDHDRQYREEVNKCCQLPYDGTS
ncbi:MAG: HEAT repeat domain-containing protein [Candidatus Omnitrophota bacterium]